MNVKELYNLSLAAALMAFCTAVQEGNASRHRNYKKCFNNVTIVSQQDDLGLVNAQLSPGPG